MDFVHWKFRGEFYEGTAKSSSKGVNFIFLGDKKYKSMGKIGDRINLMWIGQKYVEISN